MQQAIDPKSGAELTPAARSALGVVFVTLFLDLVGFSIIFPLFPGMLAYYREIEGGSGLFGALYRGLERFTQLSGSPEGDWGLIVLFGGVLGALYSLLQFLCAPLWGALSDRAGRKPVLLITLAGLFISYLAWFFAGSFALLVCARILGGIMSGNISTATAIVADTTGDKARGKGMAVIGIAFGLGFVVGPAIGGLSALVDLTAFWPELAGWGVNPYSVPAAIAGGLAVINFLQVALRLPETRPERSAPANSAARGINPLVLFNPPYPNVARTNVTYFLFLLAFSGMEFSLTFLAVDRLGFEPWQNGLMFLFIGVLLAAVQGSYVQRFAHRVGLRRMSLHGLFLIAPGLVLVGVAGELAHAGLFFAGLALLAIGAAQTTPCLTALVSVYAPPEAQGQVMGAFRSLGALARAIGPLAACLVYWRLGASTAYFAGAVFLLLPALLLRTLPPGKAAPATPAPVIEP